METKTKQLLNRNFTGKEQQYPIKVLQFGEGNFLRAFVDYAFYRLNNELSFNAGIAVVQPLEGGMVDLIEKQDGLYTLFLNGIKNKQPIQDIYLIDDIVKCVNPYKKFQDYLEIAKSDSLEFVISNTTEAGIEFIDSDTPDMKPPKSFPAKLKQEVSMKETKGIGIEAVRAVLAEKSRDGKTREVKALLMKYDAGKLSGVKPEDYAALLTEAKVL